MTPAEHYAEAERLLAAAELPAAIVNIDGPVSPEQAQELKDRLEKTLKIKSVVTAGPVTIDVSGTLAAAQVHATLALAGSAVMA